MNLSQIPVVVIAGPTGVGKTDLSIQLAQRLDGEIINGDSLQVYQGLDIGTGKIKEDEKGKIPHHLLDILKPEEDFDASRFKALASEKIIEIHQRGKIPIIVGGTGLYLEGLLYNLEFGGESSQDPELRQSIEERLDKIGPLALWQELRDFDPQAAQKIPYQNSRRTIRALQVIYGTGKLFSEQDQHQLKASTFNEVLIVLDRPRQALYDRINRRVLEMIADGLESEAYHLYNQSKGQDWQSIKGIGYKEWWPYFEGLIQFDEVVATIQQNSRRYAKRQLTWFRNRMKNPLWINMEETSMDSVINLVVDHLKERK